MHTAVHLNQNRASRRHHNLSMAWPVPVVQRIQHMENVIDKSILYLASRLQKAILGGDDSRGVPGQMLAFALRPDGYTDVAAILRDRVHNVFVTLQKLLQSQCIVHGTLGVYLSDDLAVRQPQLLRAAEENAIAATSTTRFSN